MKYKVGDKVKVRQWEALKRQYKLDEFGDIPKIGFLRMMKEYCGKVVTIYQINVTLGRYKIEEDNGAWYWNEEMFEGYAFEFGEEIEVSNDKICWYKRIYVGYIDGTDYPYFCVADGHEKDFKNGKQYSFVAWRYARPIRKRHIIIIDDKEIEISEENYQRLKESLK